MHNIKIITNKRHGASFYELMVLNSFERHAVSVLLNVHHDIIWQKLIFFAPAMQSRER